ncbi:MAG: diguanylate cyclase [Algicola sp.]|nr:diguanylate cyclase [Algicola sp.]
MRKLFTAQIAANSGLTGLLLLLLLSVGLVRADDREYPSDLPLADQLVAQARAMESDDINKAILMLKNREKEVKKVASSGELARFYNKLSELNSTLGHLAEQREYATKGLALIGDETVPIGADLNYNLGIVYEMNADFESALKYYRKGLEIAQLTNHLLYQGRGKLFISLVYTFDGDYERALEIMTESYVIAQQVNDDDLTWEVLNGLHILYGNLNDDEKALEVGLQALETSRRLGIKALRIVDLHNIGLTQLNLKQYEQANQTFEEMRLESETSTELSDMYNAYKGFAVVAFEMDQGDRALDYLTKAEEYLPHVQEVMVQIDFYLIKARVLSKEDQPSLALEVLSIAEQKMPLKYHKNDNRLGLAVLRSKSRFHAELNNYKNAYELLKSHSDGLRIFRREKTQTAIRKLRVSFDVERNESRNNMLAKDNEIKALQLKQATSEQQIQIFFLVVLGMLSVGLIFVMYRQLHSRRQLKTIAETDSLTELFNRRYAFASGEQMVKEGNEGDSPLSVIMFDLDHFKTINDTYGHPAGDLVLKTIGEISKGCLRGSDVLARIGGEEFIAILPGVKLEMAEFIAGRLKDKLETFQQQHEQNKFFVTASFGVAQNKDKDDFEHLIHRADKALYQAKDNGRNCVALAG